MNDALYSDASAKAEFIFPNGLLVRIGSSTQIQLIALKSDASEMDVASGVARFYNKNPNGMLKVTTPFGYVLAEPGSIFDLYVGDQSVEVLALGGQVGYFQQGSDARYDVIPGGASILADATQVAAGEGMLDAQWDDWNAGRDSIRTKRAEVRGESVSHLPPQIKDDAYDLDESGRWEQVMYQGEYREFWRPTVVAETWQPFTVGRWTDYYGDQVWVPEESFGYVTHHYGNWLIINGRWYWAPPAPVVEVVAGPFIGFGWYPGRVAWISSGADVGWVPLAPAEVYYSHHSWGPSAVVVTAVPAVTVAVGGLAFASAAVVVPQGAIYSVNNYSSVRVTNISQTTIVSNFHAAPVLNNTVIKDYNQTTAKYNFVNKAPTVIPHSTVVERISQNQQVASTTAKSLTASALRQAATAGRAAKPVEKAAVPPPTKLTNKLVPPSQVNVPKSQASFNPVEIKKNTKPITASSVVKEGGAVPSAPGATQPPPPGATHPPMPGVTHPPASPATQPPGGGTIAPARPQPPTPGATQPPPPGATHPPMPGVTHPPVSPAPQPPGGGTIAPARPQPPAPGVIRPPTPGATQPPPPATRPPAPALTHPPAATPAPRPEIREPTPAPKPAPAPAPAPKPAPQQKQPDKKKQPEQQ